LPDQTSTGTLLPPFIELQSVDSTNNYARGLISAELSQHGTGIFAHEQLSGKGQRGREWLSEKGSNIILTVLLDPHPLAVSNQFQLSVCVASSVHHFFSQYAGDQLKIKWPNDIYWQDRKAGGVLIENRVKIENRNAEIENREPRQQETVNSAWKWAIVGIGININQVIFPASVKNPVSLKQITGKDHNPVALAKELTLLITRNFDRLAACGFQEFYEYYNTHLFKKNEKVRLKKDNRVFEATIKSVTPSGKLVVEHAVEEEFEFGEIEWVV
jgi:BirA family biotin operon repressor/biotin-[acetyl-CoA-carboxylase] ligase